MIDNKKQYFLDLKILWKEIDTIKDYNLLKKIRFTLKKFFLIFQILHFH